MPMAELDTDSLPLFNRRSLSADERRLKALEWYLDGKSLEEIAASLTVEPATVSGYLKEALKESKERQKAIAFYLREVESLRLNLLWKTLIEEIKAISLIGEDEKTALEKARTLSGLIGQARSVCADRRNLLGLDGSSAGFDPSSSESYDKNDLISMTSDDLDSLFSSLQSQ